ncbi:MBL fold metallo-hydrolase [Asticcacaulis sp. AND118]|uniref:MBL fold metallo-hydrolase n=1 Tax=Asticcacaulis sp. AND118 TaxID=2840468 RepID=UPI001CFFEA91|nr:MBL fold metallo-hydrolase [Asticcacaulis sp. AND118]UDF02355.1 MBL fold metallo-hydrolase [Asticcacaulis sp. AND118]
MMRLKTTILGSGCSTGVPRADGYWGRCDPNNPKNRRSRCSALFQVFDSYGPESATNVVVDTAPDFRTQIQQTGIDHLDAVLWTHDHADQTHGIDDMRAFALLRKMQVPGYMDAATRETLLTRFGYVFEGKFGYPPICAPMDLPAFGESFYLTGEGGDVPVLTFDQEHGPIRSVGYRIGDVAYSSDISGLPEESFAHLSGLKVWIVDALRYAPHPTHAHLDLALEWIARVRPERAVLTNLHQEMDYEELRAQLPEGVVPAYDQMVIESDL